MKQCSIIVFGDIGRSPRMVNHALSIADTTEYRINFYAYLGSKKIYIVENRPPQTLLDNPNIRLYDLNLRIINLMKKLPRFLFLFYAIVRILMQTLYLLMVLLFSRKQDFILIQNPPSIPTLHVAWLIKILRGSKIIVDFHNYGYTLLGLQIKQKHILKISEIYEMYFGMKSDLALCVSNAMKQDLSNRWGIRAQTLYDRANSSFLPIEQIEDKHSLLQKLDIRWKNQSYNETLLTYRERDEIQELPNKQLLAISSTSWTKDEDFNILVSALDLYNDYKIDSLPNLYVVITGKGPLKEQFEQIFNQKNTWWNKVKVELKWLSAEDYPKLLSVCDFGICLHYSSSGLDLPMKVVDMFGSGIPVFAKQFKAIGELVEHQKTGMIFNDSQDLFENIVFSIKNKSLQDYKKQVQNFRKITFQQEWQRVVLPFIQKLNKN